MLKEIILATKNKDKIREIKNIIKGYDVKIKTFLDFNDFIDIEEDRLTIEENSQKKAIEISKHKRLYAIADDTGLFVDALNGRPGVYSSRYAGKNASYIDNNIKLLKELEGIKTEKRTATFRCAITLAGPSGKYITVVGEIKGYILNEMKGNNGFGYDPLFYIPEYDMTFAQMPLELKNKISHRADALNKIKPYLIDLIKNEKI